ncbi:hypothetical protein [Umezawaea tangerina]|uniref:3-oxoacyl-[acyl-carrier-protein] synthase-3 n=1 Tax=Umezawaea tangerina TaxID=84725 RepID=A0A2T0STR7_9PSEU|nr:hypothetical protein [Umezawaea tangerina]PRY36802.1 3-oxoacyl-[acyl-carrier-protein] synthase-3 [Umezawaea tangerina]
MSARAHLLGCGYRLGERREPVAALAGAVPEGFAEYRVGTGSVFDLYRPAARQALDRAGIEPRDVGVVLYASETVTGDPSAHGSAAGLMRELGLTRAYPVTVGFSDCATATAALGLAASLVRDGGSRHVLVLSGDLVRTVLPDGPLVLDGTAVASDAAAAAVVSAHEGGWEVEASARHVDYEALRTGGPARNRLVGLLTAYRTLFADLWEASGARPGDVSAVLTDNAAPDGAGLFLTEAGFTAEQLRPGDVARNGHCLGSDPLINFSDHSDDGRGSRVVLVGSGAAHLAAVLLRKVEQG